MGLKIDKSTLKTLWHTDARGREIAYDFDSGISMEEAGVRYQHSQFPLALRHSVLEIISESRVNDCRHPQKKISPTYGWKEGFEGRKCVECGGSQTKSVFLGYPDWWPVFLRIKIKKPWPKKWNASGSREIMFTRTTYSEDLVLAMANSGEYTLSEAILVAANACEGCLNVLAHLFRLNWGYAFGSEEHKRVNTSCQFCG